MPARAPSCSNSFSWAWGVTSNTPSQFPKSHQIKGGLISETSTPERPSETKWTHCRRASSYIPLVLVCCRTHPAAIVTFRYVYLQCEQGSLSSLGRKGMTQMLACSKPEEPQAAIPAADREDFSRGSHLRPENRCTLHAPYISAP
eukprot:scaffold151624_cov23-Tisochrysis_lutea.AAC.1